MLLISAVIITFNEEKNIARCIDSLKEVTSEIIVLDAFSSDRTVAIAEARGVQVRQQRFLGFTQQKNLAVSLAANDYILSLDADEALDGLLIRSILALEKTEMAQAYFMNRCTSYCGQFITHGAWYPDRKIRLFDRRIARWEGNDLHERVVLSGNSGRILQLRGDILHYSFPTIESHVQKCDRYSSIAARSLYAKEKKSNWFKMLVNPFWAFFYGYFIRLGCLDGFAGFLIAINSAHACFLKYAKLYQLKHDDQSPAKASNRVNTISQKRKSELIVSQDQPV